MDLLFMAAREAQGSLLNVLEDFSEPAVRLLVAVLLGGLIGWEREVHGRHAGLRTHLLLCVGCTLIMLVSQYMGLLFAEQAGPGMRVDPSRIAAHVVSGIGFLGAGTILVLGRRVMGLTTAACLWATAAIGLAVGAGFYPPALITFLIVMFALLVLGRVEKMAVKRDRYVIARLHFSGAVTLIEAIKSRLRTDGLKIIEYHLTRNRQGVNYRISMRYRGHIDLDGISADLMEQFGPQGLQEVEWR